MRLIDADELLAHRFVGVVGEGEKWSYMVGWNSAIEAVVENAPTIDAVPVVRCRELEAGSIVWAVERDEDNAPYSVAGVVFLAAVGEAVICSPMINGHKDVQYITDYFIKETARDWSSSAKYFPISDVYAAREEAVAALSREEARGCG